VITEYAKLRWMIDQYAPQGKYIPIISSEWGYTSITALWGSFNDDNQGKMLSRQWMINLACDIPVSIWYDWHDDGANPEHDEHHFGTTNYEYHKDRIPVYDPKTSYLAACTFNEIFNGFKYNKRISVTNFDRLDDNIYVFLFENEKDARLAVWTTDKKPQTITIPCSEGTFQAVSHLGEKLSDLQADKNGLTLTVSDGPIYLIPKTPNGALIEAIKSKGLPLAVYLCKDQKVENITLPVNRLKPTQVFEKKKYQGVEFVERCIVYPASPLTVGTPMIKKNELVVPFYNANGEAFSGKLYFNHVSGIDLLSSNPVSVNLKEGDFYSVIHLPLRETVNDANQFSLSFYLDNNNSTTRNDAPVQKFHTIDNFARYDAETLKENWELIPEGDAKDKSEQSLSPGENGELKMKYQFDTGWTYLRLTPRNNTLTIIDGKPQALTVHINADGSGNCVRIRFRDSQGQLFQVDGDKLNNKGMQYFTFDLTGINTICWDGYKDGVVYYPIVFDSLIIDGIRRTSCGPYSLDIFPPVLVYEEPFLN